MHFQGVLAAVALQEVLRTHLFIAVHSHHQQVEGTDIMDLPMSLRYHRGHRVKSFTNIKLMIRPASIAWHKYLYEKYCIDLLKQDMHSVF